MRSLVEAYSQWIDNLISENDELDTKFNGRYHEIAKENISGCMCARDRMLSGISSLQKDQKSGMHFNWLIGLCICKESI